MRLCILRAMQTVVCSVYKINISKALSEAEIGYLMVALLIELMQSPLPVNTLFPPAPTLAQMLFNTTHVLQDVNTG